MKAVLSYFLKFIELLFGFVTGITNQIVTLSSWLRFRYIEFETRPDDIFICTYPRSGTTWMQMILYQLSTDGEMDFQHISDRIPWFEHLKPGKNILNELESPRIFKTHLRFKHLPKGARYIYVARDGMDVAASYFKFYQSHQGFKGSFSKFFKMFMNGHVLYKSWFTHVEQGLLTKENDNVLFILYNDLLDDLEGSIKKIAEFCGLGFTPEQLSRIVERASFSYMKEYEEKFDAITEFLSQLGMKTESFIRQGKTGSGNDQLAEKQKEAYLEKYNTHFNGDLFAKSARRSQLNNN